MNSVTVTHPRVTPPRYLSPPGAPVRRRNLSHLGSRYCSLDHQYSSEYNASRNVIFDFYKSRGSKIMSDVIVIVTCPHCGRSGKTTKIIPAQAKIRCPGCQQSFSYLPAAPTVAPTSNSSPPPLPSDRGKMADLIPASGPLSGSSPSVQASPSVVPAPDPSSPPKASLFPIIDEFSLGQRISLGVTGIGLLLLGLAPFFKWLNFGNGGIVGLSGGGKFLLGGTVVGFILYLLALMIRRLITPAFLIIQAGGIFTVFWMGMLIWQVSSLLFDKEANNNPFGALLLSQISPGIGLYLGLIGGLMVVGAISYVIASWSRKAGNLKLFYGCTLFSSLFGISLSLLGSFPAPVQSTEGANSSAPPAPALWSGLNGRNKSEQTPQENQAPQPSRALEQVPALQSNQTPQQDQAFEPDQTFQSRETPRPDQASQPADPPSPVDQPFRRDDIEFKVDSAEIVKIAKVEGRHFVTVPTEPVLIVRFTVKNHSTNKRYFYRDYVMTLTDNLDNNYQFIEDIPNNLKEFQGYSHISNQSINPGETLKDSAVFERPLDSAKTLEVSIAGETIARVPDYEFGAEVPPPYRLVISMDTVKP